MVASFEVIEAMLSQYIYPFSRIGSLVMTMTVIGTRSVPARIKLGLSVTLTVAVAPVLPEVPNESLLTLSSWLLIMEQVIIGIALGFITKIVFETFVLGAQIIAMQTGLGFASMIDPANGLQVPVLSQFFLMLVTLMFLAINGHLVVLELVVRSFTTMPIGDTTTLVSGLKMIVDWTSHLFAAALMMSLAAALSLLMINLAFGVMTRAAPQLNIFVIGFPMTMVSGLLIIWFTMSGFIFHFEQQVERGAQLICAFIDKEC